MVRYQVFIRCRELPSAHAEYTYSLNAGSFHMAASNAIRLFRREPRVYRKRITCLELRVTAVSRATRTEEMILPLGDRASGGG
jgi:hypothetical protein